jgi:RHS repeat-associated protein
LGERVSKTPPNGITSKTYYDGPEIIGEKNIFTGIGYFVRGPGLDEIVATVSGNSVYYHYQDPQRSVVVLGNPQGGILASHAYEPFGLMRRREGQVTTYTTYTGRPLDAESGYYFLRNRYYDAATGTFVTPDPTGIAGGINLYSYVRNDPLNRTDPYGYEGSSFWSSLGAAMAADAVDWAIGSIAGSLVDGGSEAWTAAGLWQAAFSTPGDGPAAAEQGLQSVAGMFPGGNTAYTLMNGAIGAAVDNFFTNLSAAPTPGGQTAAQAAAADGRAQGVVSGMNDRHGL